MRSASVIGVGVEVLVEVLLEMVVQDLTVVRRVVYFCCWSGVSGGRWFGWQVGNGCGKGVRIGAVGCTGSAVVDGESVAVGVLLPAEGGGSVAMSAVLGL